MTERPLSTTTTTTTTVQLTALLLPVVLLARPVAPSPAVVQAPWGQIAGVRLSEREDRKHMDAYLGIPFALPPTGARRWQKPEPHPGPAKGEVFQADTYGNSCPQDKEARFPLKDPVEDCLTLNVFVPVPDPRERELRSTRRSEEEENAPKSVLVFIHGGAFTYGDAPNHKPTPLVVDGDLIVVTIQYRLGALGFLATGDDTLPGNYGLWDQRLALKWVKDNIEAFGGDPKTITVTGESAGAWSVGLQILSPHSKGLFRRAILQSGTPTILGKNQFVMNAKDTFKQVAEHFKCQRGSSAETVECLRGVDANDIAVSPMSSFKSLIEDNPVNGAFGAQVDGDFIPRDPADLLKDSKYLKETGVHDVDVLTGFNNKEMGILFAAAKSRGLSVDEVKNATFYRRILEDCVHLYTKQTPIEEAYEAVDAFYRGKRRSPDRPVAAATTANLFGDALIAAPSVLWARSLAINAKGGRGGRYLYLFDFFFKFNDQGLVSGAHNGDELPLLFDLQTVKKVYDNYNKTYHTDDLSILTNLYLQFITSFARHGNPGKTMEALLDGAWPPFRKKKQAYVAFHLSPQIKTDVYKDRIDLWLNVLPRIIKSYNESKDRARKARREEL